jgi:hypothetical protein
MKKALKYLVLLILCMINRNTQAQGYIPMLNDSAVWFIGEYVSNQAITQVQYRTESIVLNSGPPLFYNLIIDQTSLGYNVREDTTQKRVYINAGIVENILYDFNVSVGDSIVNSGIGYSFSNPIYVDSVKSLFIAGANRKVVFLRLHPNEGVIYRNYLTNNPLSSFVSGPLVWIEGIGSLYGVNYFQANFDNANEYQFLSCMKIAGNVVYINPFLQSCTQILNLENRPVLSKSVFSVQFMNSSMLLIKGTINQIEMRNSNITLYDHLGRIHVNKKEDSILSNEHIIQLETSLSTGIYFCLIQTNETRFFFKLVQSW